MSLLPFLKPPQLVILYLQNPRERYWGALRGLDGTGLILQGTELGGFEDWMRQVGTDAADCLPSEQFFPLHRVEKILVDAPSGGAPSLAQQFERRIGRAIWTVLGESGPVEA
jgi:hypothetical protein